MTREETKNLIRIIASTYPNFKMENVSDTVDAWHFFLSDESAAEILVALKVYTKTNNTGFAPSVNQLIDLARKRTEEPTMTASEAWAIVRPAIADSYYNATKYFNEFPPEIQKAVGSPQVLQTWGDSDRKTVDSVISSNFKKNYEAILNRKKEAYIHSPAVAQLVSDLSNKIGIEKVGV